MNTANTDKSPIRYKVKEDKALEVIVYIASKRPGISAVELSNIIFLAEREHLNDWGRGLIHDTYTRYNDTLVPRFIRDLIEDTYLFSSVTAKMKDDAFRLHARDLGIYANREHNSDVFSETDTEMLDKYLKIAKDELASEVLTCETTMMAPIGVPIGWEHFLDKKIMGEDYEKAIEDLREKSYFLAMGTW